jgi:hypothetical protein
MGAVASGMEKANNAAMFSTTDTLNQAVQQIDIASTGEAAGEQKARQQDNISAQAGVGLVVHLLTVMVLIQDTVISTSYSLLLGTSY